MARSIWKGYITVPKASGLQTPFLSKETVNDTTKNVVVKVARSEMVSPLWIDRKVQIHTGNNWKTVLITNNHVGQKAGEFAATKVPAIFKRHKRKIGKIKYGS